MWTSGRDPDPDPEPDCQGNGSGCGYEIRAGSGIHPDVGRGPSAHDATMPEYVLYHRHAPTDCAASFAAWSGFSSPLRRVSAPATCRFGAHEIWWTVTADDAGDALALLPRFVSSRTIAIRVATIETP
jgi:hypothetical protein